MSTECRSICRPRGAQIMQDPEIVSQSINQCTQIQESKQNLALYTFVSNNVAQLVQSRLCRYSKSINRCSISVSQQISQSVSSSVSKPVCQSVNESLSSSISHSLSMSASRLYLQLNVVNKAGIWQVSHSVSWRQSVSQ